MVNGQNCKNATRLFSEGDCLGYGFLILTRWQQWGTRIVMTLGRRADGCKLTERTGQMLQCCIIFK